MHFVEGMLVGMQLAVASSSTSSHSNSIFPAAWTRTPHLRSLIPRAIPTNTLPAPTRLEFWFDFSSPWAYLAYTQLPRLQRTFPGLTIELKPFVLGILFREIGAPQMPALAVSAAKAAWSRQDHADWTAWWNAVGDQEGDDANARVEFEWATVFPIRSPVLLRVGIVEPRTVPVLYSACWSQNLDVASPAVLNTLLTTAGFNATDLLARANSPGAKTKLRELTAEAKDLGICGAPTYRVLRQNQSGGWDQAGGLVWGQDEVGVLEDLIAGWDCEGGREVAVPGKVVYEGVGKGGAKL
ncbi:hypothetical protein J1614_004246 [Plenodomus biglobosus]|nr:hypothetical protein J1614_004246 [Plenodomus biglobosus]